jgi:PAS domain S-box-containing protein
MTATDYRRIFESAREAIVILDPSDETVLDVNPRACELYGFSRDEFIGMSMKAISRDVVRGERELARTLEQGQYYCFETVQYHKDGRELDLEINASVIEYRGRAAILSFNRDVTDWKRAAELRRAKEQAEQASAAKSIFLANISHELRTPLAGIIGLAELLQRRDLDPVARQYAELLHSSSQSLLTIVNDLLDIARIEAGKLVVVDEPYQPRRLLHDIVSLLAANAAATGVRLEADAGGLPPWVLGDGMRVRQVLLNLAGNAVKFTASGTITVRGRAVGPALRFEVEDTGPGIAPDVLPKLFAPFVQGDGSASRAHGGAGLGLAISKALVEKMGGTLTATSQLGRGSLFRFDVPLRACADPAPAPRVEQSLGAGTHPHVLLVEDSPINRLVITRYLEDLGCVTDIADDGLTAVEAATRRTYDLILMDCQLPGLDGYEATERIRALSGRNARVPIVALTANAMAGDRVRCLAAGMNDYLAKPLTRTGLADVLHRWVR